MIFSFTTSLAALLCLVAIPATHAVDIDVVVGGPGVLAFSPESVTAAAGDVVRFSFRQKNHTATQSTLASPCVKLASGFDSGFLPVPPTQTEDFPVALYTVVNTDPVWVYCAQGTHCSSAGMVFAVNPGSEFARFKAAATGGAAPPASSATSTGASAAPSSTGATDFKVTVGGSAGLVYSPNNIKAKRGDTVTFEFRQKNHTVTQSTFDVPCRSLTLTSTTGQTALDSGYIPVADGATNFPTWSITINETTPLWFYCKQGNHCGQGMVLAINSVDTGPNSFSAFQARAKEQNGTAATTAATPSPTGAALHVGFGSSLALAMFGLVAGLVL